LYILGIRCAHPEIEISNQFLESLGIESSAEWIREKLGIEDRRTTLPLDYIARTHNANPRQALKVASNTTTGLAVAAAEEALRRAGVAAEKVGLLIVNSCSPDTLVPSQAQLIAARLGINCTAYDVSTACPGFALQFDYLANFKEELLPEYVLCVTSATLTQRVDYKDRSDSAIWGDGAAAAVVSASHPGKLKMVDSFFATNPLRADAVVVDTFGHFHQDGRAVRDFSVRWTVRMIKSVESRYEIDWTRDVFVGHQANRTMLEQITNNRKIPAGNHWHNVTNKGNQGEAGAPAVLAENWDRIQRGQKIVVAVLGAGLSWGSVLFEAV
jgi:3-oxoacyl-[acyl-carrier-protein] synthase-3